MYDAVVIVAGVSCNKSKIGGWGFSAYDVSESITYSGNFDTVVKNKLIDGYYLSNYGVNRKWKVAENESDENLKVLKVRELIETFGATEEPASVAKSESLGFLEAIKLIDERHWKKVLLCCDSRYVAQNLDKLLKSNDAMILKRKDGKNITTYDVWSEATLVILKLLSKGVNIKWQWIQDNLPKDLTEYSKILAKKGQALAFNKKDKSIESYPEGKKKVPENKCHGFLLQSRMYFIPSNINVTEDGRRYYFCGNHGDKDEWCGKPKSDSTMSVFILDELDPVMELLMGIKREYSNNHNGQVIKLDNVRWASTRHEIISYHKDLMIYDSVTGNIENYAGKEFLQERRPPYLFFRLFEKLNNLYHKLNDYNNDILKEETFYIDITDKMYVKDKRGNKTLNKHFITSKYIKIPIDKLKTEITLTTGVELLPDMSLKRIASENPIVRLYIERVGPILYKYYVYIKTNKASGLFTTTDANSIFLTH